MSGPITLNNGFGLNRISWQQQVINPAELTKKLAISESIYATTGQISLLGGLSFKEIIPAFEIKNDDTTVTFSGYKSRAWTGSDDQLNYEGNTGSLVINDIEQEVSLSDLSMKMVLDIDLEKIKESDFCFS